MFKVSKQISLGLDTVAHLSFREFENQDNLTEGKVNQFSISLFLYLSSNTYLLSLACLQFNIGQFKDTSIYACRSVFMHLENREPGLLDAIYKHLKEIISALTEINVQIEQPDLIQN